MRVTLGGARLGSGNRMQVDLHGYGRSTHDLSQIVRTTASAGTLIPVYKKIALPGDTWDLDIDCEIQTHPTTGPLFGSFKVQIDVFTAPIRLYNSLLHNNKLNIGNHMETVFFPVIELMATNGNDANIDDSDDPSNFQINPSCLLKYLGISGVGANRTANDETREFNGTPVLIYYDIYKNYYANKQENVGYIVHSGFNVGGAIGQVLIYDQNGNQTGQLASIEGIYMANGYKLIMEYPATAPNLDYIEFQINNGFQTMWVPAKDLFTNWVNNTTTTPDQWEGLLNSLKYPQINIYNIRAMGQSSGSAVLPPLLQQFPLENIDDMREAILAFQSTTTPFKINTQVYTPYQEIANVSAPQYLLGSQEGLAIKCYQSDLFNNWLRTELIDGPTGINQLTAIDTSSGEFTINQLIISRAIYNVMNRVMVAGGSYRDWMGAVYDDESQWIPETPIYEGGLIKELSFEEVISNAAGEGQPLGTLGGRGRLTGKHKGGKVIIKVNEPSYIMILFSLTPRIGYSQGNEWDMYALRTMNDLFKPGMDQLGFEDGITEQMAYWDTEYVAGATLDWVQQSYGKQPAWINYMTAVNKHFGNFAIPTNEQFMVLDRQYEMNTGSGRIQDLTTYIDPAKYNTVFAQTSLDAQNFWVNVGIKAEARRKMSGKLMPNL